MALRKCWLHPTAYTAVHQLQNIAVTVAIAGKAGRASSALVAAPRRAWPSGVLATDAQISSVGQAHFLPKSHYIIKIDLPLQIIPL